MKFSRLAVVLLSLSTLATAALSHVGHQARDPKAPVVKEQKPWGIAASRDAVQRTIDIDMSDDMRFSPGKLVVTEGEVVRLRVRNVGKVMHELVLGTRQELEEHAELMKRFPDMEHDEPYMAHVEPGKTAEIIWHFNRAGNFYFGCLLPGHFEAGMVGPVEVRERAAR